MKKIIRYITKPRRHQPNMAARQQRIDKLDTHPNQERARTTSHLHPVLRAWHFVFTLPFFPVNLILKFFKINYRLAFRELVLIILAISLLVLPGFNYEVDPVQAQDDFDINIDQSYFSLTGDFIFKQDSYEALIDPTKIVEYEVKDNDTVASVAKEFGITPSTILWANNIPNPDILTVGRKIKILPVTGILYKVKRGDTSSSIARAYAIKEDYIAYQNQLDDDRTLLVGEEIILPNAKPRANRRLSVQTAYTVNPGLTRKDGDGRFVYPTTGVITQFFHQGHYAIDIANPKLPPIYAADAGTVMRARYSGWNGGYGNYVVLEHNDGLQTLYAHMSKIYVKQGDQIDRGQPLGQMGSTGRSTGPHVHFEVIDHNKKKNPLYYF